MDRTILVTGGTGQLATALARAAQELPICVVGRPRFDFGRPEAFPDLFAAVKPHALVNAAAYTAVDAAETDAEAALKANRDGPAELARLCSAARIPLIHISTDYVFDGTKGTPYLETDPPAPLGVYGASKLAGEEAVLAVRGQVTILRTSWVISATGRNFVRSMLAARQNTDRLRVVADQRGRPTAASDLATAVLAVLHNIETTGWQEQFGTVFHVAGSGETTWHGLATAIFEEAGRYGVRPPEIAPIATADWPTPARRPADSRLDCRRIDHVFGVRLPPWRASLGAIIDELLGGSAR